MAGDRSIKVRQIERRPVLDYAAFWTDFVALKRPVIVSGAVKHWPALSKWKPEYFQARFADSRFNVTTSNTGIHDPYRPGSSKKMAFDEAISRMLSGELSRYYIMQVPI